MVDLGESKILVGQASQLVYNLVNTEAFVFEFL